MSRLRFAGGPASSGFSAPSLSLPKLGVLILPPAVLDVDSCEGGVESSDKAGEVEKSRRLAAYSAPKDFLIIEIEL